MPLTTLTKVNVANMALGILEEAPIAALTDNKRSARLANLHFDITVEQELQANVWKFAIKSTSLTGTDTGSIAGSLNWEYDLPADFVRMLPLGYDETHNATPVSWELRDGKLYSDQDSPRTFRYIYNVTDPQDWDALFVDVVTAALAVKLAWPLTHKQSAVQLATAAYDRAVEKAQTFNAVQRAGTLNANSWAIARGDYRWRV